MAPPPYSLVSRLGIAGNLLSETLEMKAGTRILLERAGLDDFDGMWEALSPHIITRHADRNVVVLELGAEGRRRRFFLKRLGRMHAKHMLEAVLSMEAPVSKCRREWDFAASLERAGVGAPPVAALGERRLGLWPLESFLLVEEIPGAAPLDAALENLSSEPARPPSKAARELAASLADAIARMHREGLFHQDLYSKHIFVRREGGRYAINIIDLQRMRRARGLSWAARDLAALNVTLPPRLAGRRRRLEFLLRYWRCMDEPGGREGLRKLAGLVISRSNRICRRSKFRGINWRDLETK